MTNFDYKQRASTPEFNDNYETIFGDKYDDEGEHEDIVPGNEESGDE